MVILDLIHFQEKVEQAFQVLQGTKPQVVTTIARILLGHFLVLLYLYLCCPHQVAGRCSLQFLQLMDELWQEI